MNPIQPMLEDSDLHAFVDGQLSGPRSREVQRHLDGDPEAAAKARDFVRQGHLLREQLRAKHDEPIPDVLRPAAIAARLARRRNQYFRRLAAMLAIALVSAAAGWLARPWVDRTQGSDTLIAEAVGAHRTFVVEHHHAVAIPASDATLVSWLSTRLGRPVAAPDLAPYGFQLMGANLLSTRAGPAVQLMYDGERGTRLTLYLESSTDDQERTPSAHRQNGLNVVYWADQGMRCVTVAAIETDRLQQVADSAYGEILGPPRAAAAPS